MDHFDFSMIWYDLVRFEPRNFHNPKKKKLINTGWVEEKYRDNEAELGSLRFGMIWYDEIFTTPPKKYKPLPELI